MRVDNCSDSIDSWLKQHIVRRPCKMRIRRGCDDEENADHIELTASRSAIGRASSDWLQVKEVNDIPV
jgi:hypothetical protein